MTQDPFPFDASVVIDTVIMRAVKVSEVLHLHDDEWPDYPALPLRPVRLVESELSMLDLRQKELFFAILPRYRYLEEIARKGELPPMRVVFETRQLTNLCLDAWSTVDRIALWPAVERVLAQL